MLKKVLSLVLAGTIVASTQCITSFAITPKTDSDYIKDEIVRYLSYLEFSEKKSAVLVSEKSLTSDGLCASSLVGATDGVFLTIDESKQSYKTIDNQLKSLKTINNIYIIGGNKSISTETENGLNSLGYNCERIEGKDRIETSFKIADKVKEISAVKEYAVARAYKGDADAVSIAYTAKRRKMPVVLTKDGKNLSYNTSGKKVYVIGGTSVINDSLVKSLNAKRLAGKDRYRTNEAINNYFNKNENAIRPVDGDNSRLGIAVMASNISDTQIGLVSINGYKGHIANKWTDSYYIPMTKKTDSYLYSTAVTSAIPGRLEAVEQLYKKTKFKRYDYVFASVDPHQMPTWESKYIEDYDKNYYTFVPLKAELGEDGYWTQNWDLADNNIYLVNKKTKKPYKYNNSKKIHQPI